MEKTKYNTNELFVVTTAEHISSKSSQNPARRFWSLSDPMIFREVVGTINNETENFIPAISNNLQEIPSLVHSSIKNTVCYINPIPLTQYIEDFNAYFGTKMVVNDTITIQEILNTEAIVNQKLDEEREQKKKEKSVFGKPIKGSTNNEDERQ